MLIFVGALCKWLRANGYGDAARFIETNLHKL